MNTFSFPENADFAPLLVRVITQGERYGTDDAITHKSAEPLIEFRDAAQSLPIAQYYLSDIEDCTGALNLRVGMPQWSVSAEVMRAVLDAARKVTS